LAVAAANYSFYATQKRMTEFLDRFSFDAPKMNAQILACLVLVWLLVLVCGILSINSQPFSSRQRWFWILVIVCLPCVGLLCYLPFSLNKDRLSKLYRGKARK
jgi:hypothetical protein